MKISIVLLALFLQACGGATASDIQKPIRIAALGDSITQAFMCDRSPGDVDCYPRAVQSKSWPAKLEALNSRLNVSSYAIAGCQLAVCRSETDLSVWLPADYVVLLFGVNEAAAGIPVDTFIASIKSSIDTRPGVKYIVIKPPLHFPFGDSVTDEKAKRLLPQYRAALDSLTNAVVIDPLGTADWWCDLKRDPHPCEAAHEAIAQAVNATIQKIEL
jgi:hypothetical protein